MRKSNLIIIAIFLLLNNFILLNLQSKITNSIVVKVGESAITSIDVENEIITNLIINKQEINQQNINQIKDFAVKNLIMKSIKRSEIKKYEIRGYDQKELKNYINKTALSFDTDQKGLKKIFKQNKINFQQFIKNYETELLWNTLIFQIYKNQTNVNIIEVKNEVSNIGKGKTEEELKKIRETIINQKKQEKLSLFSRSHFSNLENSISINFQ